MLYDTELSQGMLLVLTCCRHEKGHQDARSCKQAKQIQQEPGRPAKHSSNGKAELKSCLTGHQGLEQLAQDENKQTRTGMSGDCCVCSMSSVGASGMAVGQYLLEEVHGDPRVPDASHLVGRHEALPVAAQPVTRTGLVVLHNMQLSTVIPLQSCHHEDYCQVA